MAAWQLVIKSQAKSDIIQSFRKFDINKNYFKGRDFRRDSAKEIGAFQRLQYNCKW